MGVLKWLACGGDLLLLNLRTAQFEPCECELRIALQGIFKFLLSRCPFPFRLCLFPFLELFFCLIWNRHGGGAHSSFRGPRNTMNDNRTNIRDTRTRCYAGERDRVRREAV